MDGPVRKDVSSWTALANQILSAGVDAIQLRDKRRSDRDLLDLARRLRQCTHQHDCRLIINDRPDLALLCDADGVHLGQGDIPVATARRIVGDRLAIGVSTHNRLQLEGAVLDGADYVGCGPVFPSSTKSFDRFAGVEFLSEVSSATQLPAFAIGGITPANVARVVAAGFRRIAVGGGVTRAADPATAVEQLRAALATGI